MATTVNNTGIINAFVVSIRNIRRKNTMIHKNINLSAIIQKVSLFSWSIMSFSAILPRILNFCNLQEYSLRCESSIKGTNLWFSKLVESCTLLILQGKQRRGSECADAHTNLCLCCLSL